MVRLVDVLSFVIGVFFLYRSYKLVREKKEDVKSFLLWVFIGAGLVFLSFSTSSIDYLLAFFNMTSTANLVFTVGIFLSLIMIFELFKTLKGLEHKVSMLNDELSIYRREKEKRERR